jgi:uncharacterized membrane protein
MSDYEIIGRVTAWLGAACLLVGFILLILRGAWYALKEIYGWPRLVTALKLLREHEQRLKGGQHEDA